MNEQSGAERIGRALQAMAADLAKEQRRVMRLRRENRELKAQVAALQTELGRAVGAAPEHGPEPGSAEPRRRRSSGKSAFS